ncbi:MAG: transposase [Cyclobacteriaceae bacterium]|nr:transposase [Cyclobacteriaceae bacterium]
MAQFEIFPLESTISPKWYIFKNLEIGKVYDSLPLKALEQCLPSEPNDRRGAPRWFSNRGMFALMFLKHYLNISDRKLIDRFNTDWSLQLFCHRPLAENEQIKDFNLLSRVRTYIAENSDLNQVQNILLKYWEEDIENTHVLSMDATCYESYIRYPTDVKLLWESVEWVYQKLIFKISKSLNIKRPRNKFIEQKRKQLVYNKLRRKSIKKGKARKKSLLYLLEKGLAQLQELLDTHPQIDLTTTHRTRIRTIKKVLQQQSHLFNNPTEKVKDRIVSLYKPYVRPIVRGKENKPVEFGLKAHMLQTGGIQYFDLLDFKAYNECKRLKISCTKHKLIFGSVLKLSADRIYHTNENRRYVTPRKIFTNFPKKGPVKLTKPEKTLQSILNKDRSTILEGSFGNHKNHYGLRKVKAVGVKNEKVWVFFGVMAANAKKIALNKASPPIQLAA